MSLERRGDYAEGILVPFASAADDKFGTYWDERSDFALDLFAPHPVLEFHGLRSLSREGVFERFGIERGAGLFARARLNSDSSLHALLESGRASWSSAAVPHLVKLDERTGYVSRWPIFEGSIAGDNVVGARRGLTKAQYARAGIDAPGELEVPYLRSLWIGVGTMDQPEKKAEAKSEAKAEAKPETKAEAKPETKAEAKPEAKAEAKPELASMIDIAVRAALSAQKSISGDPEPPGRTLPPKAPETDPVLKTPQIQVASEWDGIDLLGMAWHHAGSRAVGVSRDDAGIDDRFLRALSEKVEKQWTEDQKVEERFLIAGGYRLPVLGLRAIDHPTFSQWNRRIPYLRANEAMLSTLATHGDELVPSLLSSVLYYYIRMNSVIAQALDTFQMPSQPFKYPTIVSGPEFRAGVELTDAANFSVSNAAVAYSQITTGDVDFSAGKLEAYTLYSRELVEDSGVNFSQAAANSYVDEMAHTLDYMLLNGDTRTGNSNISYHGATPVGVADYDRVVAFDGIRKKIVAADSVAVAELADDSIQSVMKLMGDRGKIGREISNLFCLVPPEVSYMLDVLPAYKTMDQVGSMATLLRGQLGLWRSVPLLSSEDFPQTNETGVVNSDATDNTKGAFVVVHRGAVKVGMRRRPEIEQARIPGVDGSFIHGSMRLDVQLMEPGAAAMAYNVTV